jgi:formylglycine-generating enzyme required for sulfatase activity
MRSLIAAMLVLAVCTPVSFARQWTDSTGKFKVEAEFVEFKDGAVRLKKASGSTFTIPFEKLSQAFLKKLNAKMGWQGGKFVLPSEAQWEYACRAGTITKYYFGDDESKLGEYAWYHANSGDKTHPVGEKKPNAWGLYDMHGNLLEWCQDWYSITYYANSATDDPTGATMGSARVNRGGSRFFAARDCRSANRVQNEPVARDSVLGFRVARVPADK